MSESLIRLILEIISDLRDPLEELESEEIMAVRKQGEERYEELVAQIEELEARKERCLKKKDAHSVKSIVKVCFFLSLMNISVC